MPWSRQSLGARGLLTGRGLPASSEPQDAMLLVVRGCSTKGVLGNSRQHLLVWRPCETYIACRPRHAGFKRISLTSLILSPLVSRHGTTCPGGRLASAPNRSGSMFDLRLFPEARIIHDLPAPTADMAILPGVRGSRTLRRTEQVRLRSESRGAAGWVPGGTTISTISLRRLVYNAG
jgi:hypothetical protein